MDSRAEFEAIEKKYKKLLVKYQQASQERESLRQQTKLLRDRIKALEVTGGLAPMRTMQAKKIIRQFAAMPDAPVTELVRMVERHHHITMEKDIEAASKEGA